jgi:hypothetical protein
MQRAPSLSPRNKRRQCSPGSPLGTATTHTLLSFVLQQAVPALAGAASGASSRARQWGLRDSI